MSEDALKQTLDLRAKRLQEREQGDIRKVLSLPEGRRFVWKLMSDAGVFRSSFTGNSQTFFNEGQRNMGLVILNQVMGAKPEAFTQMQAEAASEKRQHDEELKKAQEAK